MPGWDVFATSSNLKPTTDTDIMGYCKNQWISDYVYKSGKRHDMVIMSMLKPEFEQLRTRYAKKSTVDA